MRLHSSTFAPAETTKYGPLAVQTRCSPNVGRRMAVQEAELESVEGDLTPVRQCRVCSGSTPSFQIWESIVRIFPRPRQRPRRETTTTRARYYDQVRPLKVRGGLNPTRVPDHRSRNAFDPVHGLQVLWGARKQAPSVRVMDPGAQVARLVAETHLVGLIVRGGDGWPSTMLPCLNLLYVRIPTHIRDDVALAGPLGLKLSRKLLYGTLRDLLPLTQDIDELPVADANTMVLEVAVAIVREGGAVVDGRDSEAWAIRAIGVSHLLDHLLSTRPQP